MSDTGEDASPVRKPASRGEARRRAFLEAATDVFLEQGYEAASVNEVVRRAGGSLATLYAQFRNKEGLFLAVVGEATERFAESLSQSVDPDWPIERGLQSLGEQFLRSLLEPRSLAFFRIMVGEGRKFPDLMAQFLKFGPERARAEVTRYVLVRAEREELPIGPAEADFVGSAFCDMIRARHQYRALAGDDYQLSEADLRAHVAQCVAVVLNGVRPRPAQH